MDICEIKSDQTLHCVSRRATKARRKEEKKRTFIISHYNHLYFINALRQVNTSFLPAFSLTQDQEDSNKEVVLFVQQYVEQAMQ
jgi:ribosomal protein S2